MIYTFRCKCSRCKAEEISSTETAIEIEEIELPLAKHDNLKGLWSQFTILDQVKRFITGIVSNILTAARLEE